MRRPEEQLHRSLVAYLRMALPKPWLVLHVPNGGGRSKAEAGILKAMGVLAGMPDLLVIGPQPFMRPHWDAPIGEIPRGERFPQIIALELKAPPKPLKRGGVSQAKPRLSDAQRDVIAQLAACGIPTLVIDNMDEAIRALTQLGVPLKGRQP